ncbi:MAG: hypothetical protein AAF417_20810 [Pseudomonadota bacterium]
MNRTLIRRIAVAVFLLNAVAVTWPGIAPFRTAEPFVFGFPQSMAWPIAWILIGWITLMVLDYFERKD